MQQTNISNNHNQNHICFDDLSKQVCNLTNVILGDIERGFENSSSEDLDNLDFSHHKFVTKSWFERVSSSSKKCFIIVLLEDVQSAWTLSLLLKSIWNCRPKDAVPSPFEAWSVYDQVPMDHNRTVKPLKMLVEVMETERMWFRTLEPYNQAELLSELLKSAGGPIVWEVFYKAQAIFEGYRDYQLQNIQECAADGETQDKTIPVADDKGKKDPRPKPTASVGDSTSQTKQPATQVQDSAQRELEMRLAQWDSIIKSMKDTQKLEEVELNFIDGTTQRIWKINRPKPEVIETVDYLQLLPLSVAKQILNYVPYTQLNDCARVNRYWAYLVEELRAELAARLKINTEIKKLTELMLSKDQDNRDPSMNQYPMPMMTAGNVSCVSRLFHEPTATSALTSEPPRSHKFPPNSVFRQILNIKNKKRAKKLPPIRKLADLSETLDRRGAANDSLWEWCKKVLDLYKKPDTFPPLPDQRRRRSTSDGIMEFRHIHFPCPLMTKNIVLPLKPALTRNFTTVASLKKKVKPSDIQKTQINNSTKKKHKRYSIWSKDFSSLYTAVKIANYKSLTKQ